MTRKAIDELDAILSQLRADSMTCLRISSAALGLEAVA